MRIDHVALFVHGLEPARMFFEHYFAAQTGPLYHNPKTGLSSYFLSFDTGARLELMALPTLSDAPDVYPQTGLTHLAFSLGSRQAVDELAARLSAEGYQLVSQPRVTGDGYYESCVSGPESLRLELTV